VVRSRLFDAKIGDVFTVLGFSLDKVAAFKRRTIAMLYVFLKSYTESREKAVPTIMGVYYTVTTYCTA
jgi:hypothetical protein